MTLLSPLRSTSARPIPPARRRARQALSRVVSYQPGPLGRMLIKVAVFAPLLVGAFALRWAVLLFQP